MNNNIVIKPSHIEIMFDILDKNLKKLKDAHEEKKVDYNMLIDLYKKGMLYSEMLVDYAENIKKYEQEFLQHEIKEVFAFVQKITKFLEGKDPYMEEPEAEDDDFDEENQEDEDYEEEEEYEEEEDENEEIDSDNFRRK